MPRPHTIRQNIFPYHVTSRSNDKKWFELPISEIWNIAQKSICIAHEKNKVEVISFVLMSNHYHMILRTPDSNIDRFMHDFNTAFSKNIKLKNNNRNRIFGGRYHWCLIKSTQYFANTYRYVYQNPLRAKLVNRSEDYPYSTLFYIARSKNFIIPIFDKYGFKDEYGLNWLNEEIDSVEEIRSGLKKREF
jgi:putative transposase